MIFTVDAVEDGEYMGHCSGSYEVGGDGRAVFLPCDPFLHQSDVSLLLFGGAALRTQGGFEDVVQLCYDSLHFLLSCLLTMTRWTIMV